MPEQKTADPSVDLAALDALFAAATPGEWEQGDSIAPAIVYATGGTDTYRGSVLVPIVACEPTEQTDSEGRNWFVSGTAKANATLIAALHNAWPAIRRRLEIGDAAWRARAEAADAWAVAWAKAREAKRRFTHADGTAEDYKRAVQDADAARRRYEETVAGKPHA